MARLTDRRRTTIATGALLAACLAHAQPGAPTAGDRGEAVFEYWCAPCHADGPGRPGTSALEAKYQGSLPAPLLERTDLTPAAIEAFVRNGVSVMPPFRKTEISDADLAALADYMAAAAD